MTKQWNKEEIETHIKENVDECGAMVVVGALFKKLYGVMPEIGLSGFKREAIESVFASLPDSLLEKIDHNTGKHVDDFIEEFDQEHAYPKWVLLHFRLSAHLKGLFYPLMKEHKLFCIYEKKKYAVIGASRLGDIWLSSNGNFPYEKRVMVDEVSDWSKK